MGSRGLSPQTCSPLPDGFTGNVSSDKSEWDNLLEELSDGASNDTTSNDGGSVFSLPTKQLRHNTTSLTGLMQHQLQEREAAQQHHTNLQSQAQSTSSDRCGENDSIKNRRAINVSNLNVFQLNLQPAMISHAAAAATFDQQKPNDGSCPNNEHVMFGTSPNLADGTAGNSNGVFTASDFILNGISPKFTTAAFGVSPRSPLFDFSNPAMMASAFSGTPSGLGETLANGGSVPQQMVWTPSSLWKMGASPVA